MRPIERPIFDGTRAWLEQNPNENFLVVLDEAHLYRGASGAEVGLLIRRLRDRLGIAENRFQVICATASFRDHEAAPDFGAQLSGIPANTFLPITGSLDLKVGEASGTNTDGDILFSIDLEQYYLAKSNSERIDAVRELLDYRNVSGADTAESALTGLCQTSAQ